MSTKKKLIRICRNHQYYDEILKFQDNYSININNISLLRPDFGSVNYLSNYFDIELKLKI